MLDAATFSGSIDLVARYEKTSQLLFLTLDPTCACGAEDELRCRGFIGDYGLSRIIPIQVHVPKATVTSIRIQEERAREDGAVQLFFVDEHSHRARPRYRLVETKDPTGRYQVYAGQCDGDNGVVIDMLMWSDVHPAVVIVGLAALCLLIKKLDEWTTECDQVLATTIAACRAAGGIPVYHIDGTVVVSFSPQFSIGCEAHCVWDRCEPPPQMPPGTSITTTTTTTTKPDGTTTTSTTTTVAGARVPTAAPGASAPVVGSTETTTGKPIILLPPGVSDTDVGECYTARACAGSRVATCTVTECALEHGGKSWRGPDGVCRDIQL